MTRKYNVKPYTIDEAARYVQNRHTVEDDTGCWIWNLHKDSDGYGLVDSGTRTYKHYRTPLIHRISYQIYKGEIGKGLVIRHRCNNPGCCNPDHLEAGTKQENANDRSEPIQNRTTPALIHMKKKLEIQLAEIDEQLRIRAFLPV